MNHSNQHFFFKFKNDNSKQRVYFSNDIFTFEKFNTFFWDFSPNFYKKLYPDVKHLNRVELMKHYFYIGRMQKRIYNNKIKILIVCDPWDDGDVLFTSGGNKALYNLGKIINKTTHANNIYAKMYDMSRQNINNPYCKYFAYDNEVNSKTLVIYPDGNYGNPLSGKHVMRWILLEVGTTYRPLDIINTWNLNDFVYHWQPSLLSKNIKILNNTIVDESYINYLKPRKKDSSCYLIKKRTFFEKNIKFIHPEYSIYLDKLSKQEIIAHFNTCESFYCYDLKTFFVIGSIICGCKVILVPDNKTKTMYIENSIFDNFPKFEKMFAWGNADIENINYSQDDVADLIKYINSLSESVKVFLEDIYNFFHSQCVNIPNVKSVYNM